MMIDAGIVKVKQVSYRACFECPVSEIIAIATVDAQVTIVPRGVLKCRIPVFAIIEQHFGRQRLIFFIHAMHQLCIWHVVVPLIQLDAFRLIVGQQVFVKRVFPFVTGVDECRETSELVWPVQQDTKSDQLHAALVIA